MDRFQEKLGYRFRDQALLKTALTHPSFGSDHGVPHYQRLEFLGDAVLELAVSEHLFHALPAVPEGTLTRMRAHIVREEALSEAARRLEIGRLVRLSVGEERSGGRDKPSILSDVLEAVFAAVYLDGGQEEARRTVLQALNGFLNPVALTDCLDEKSRLQEAMQKRGSMPCYVFVSSEGPAHAPTFRYQVFEGDALLGEGEGFSKQLAQQAAAKNALRKLGEHHCG
ncbi:MAG: Ribonuclease 3 [Firmicutes bacterium ADurb.Bin467]|nr:MAG: Ribonuclease 3 [Firmicutes bacterium ADurb.Bin467]